MDLRFDYPELSGLPQPRSVLKTRVYKTTPYGLVGSGGVVSATEVLYLKAGRTDAGLGQLIPLASYIRVGCPKSATWVC